MRPFQLVVLAALFVGVATYVGLRVGRSIKHDDEFYGMLLDRLSDVLGSKGFALTGPMVSPRVSGLHSATFEGASAKLDLVWDSREREVLLRRRFAREDGFGSAETLASAHVPNHASAGDYRAAADIMVRAADAVGGAA